MRMLKPKNLALAAAAFVAIQTGILRADDIEDKNVVDNKSTVDKGTVTEDLGRFSRSPFRFSAALRIGYDDNVFTTKFNRVSSWFTNASVELTYDFGSPRTQINLNTGAGLIFYFDRPGEREWDVNAHLSLAITHQATPRLTLGVSSYSVYQVEPDLNLTVGLNRRSGNYFYTIDKFSIGYQWAPRFSTVSSYTFVGVDYENSTIGFFEDRTEHIFGNEFRFLLAPTTSLVGEYRVGFVQYDKIARDSVTHYALGGVDHSFSPRFNVSFRAGGQFRHFNHDGDRSEPYFEGTLKYALGRHTSLTWTNRYSIEEPDIAITRSRKTYRTGLRLSHGITPRITSTLGVYWQHDEYEGVNTPFVFSPAFTEDSVDVAVGVRYAINRNWSVGAGYNHTEVISDILLREFSRNRYFVGVGFNF